MGLKALLTVDLENGVTNNQRERFNNKLNDLMWNKLENFTTAWISSFKDNVTVPTAFAQVKKDVKAAADEGGIKTFHGAVQFCEDEPHLFKS